MPATPHPLGNQGALVLGHRTADLEHQLVVGVIAHRTIEELDAAPGSLQFFQDHHLMDVVAGESIRRSQEDQIECRLGRLIAQVIQAGAFELGPTLAIVTEDMFLGQTPIGLCGHIGPQTGQLLVNRVGLLLAAG